jgi:hypothetical protein
MPTHLAGKSKRIAMALLFTLNTAPLSRANPAADPGAEPAATSAAAPAATSAAASPSPVETEIRELRESIQSEADKFSEHEKELAAERTALHNELDRLSALESKLGITDDSGASSAALAAVDDPNLFALNVVADPNVAPASTQTPDEASLLSRLQSVEAGLKDIGPFSLAGDFRLRDEPYFGGPVNGSQDRNRERYRARLQFSAKLNGDISGGLGLSTGDLNDPITSNQTANQFFTRKPFALDRAFVNYNPHEFSALTLIGGKFAYPWYRTQLTWDDDIFPEGVAEKLEWKSDNWQVLRQFALIGFQLPFAETQNPEAIRTSTQPVSAILPYPTASIQQSVVYGGQIQTRWQLGSRVSFTADTAFYNYHNADPIALANQVAYGNPTTSSPVDGLLTLNNTLTNSFQTVTETVTAVGNSGTTPGTITVSKQIIAAKLNSKFKLSDSIAQFDIKTWSDRWPIRFLGDYVQNDGACDNDPSAHPYIPASQLTTLEKTATITFTTTNGTCDSRERRANWLESRIGRQQEKGDWQFAYTHMIIDREAVMSLFDFSDIRQGSNVAQNRVEAYYTAYKNVQLAFTGFFGRSMGTTDATETLLKRLQFDVIYKF